MEVAISKGVTIKLVSSVSPVKPFDRKFNSTKLPTDKNTINGFFKFSTGKLIKLNNIAIFFSMGNIEQTCIYATP